MVCQIGFPSQEPVRTSPEPASGGTAGEGREPVERKESEDGWGGRCERLRWWAFMGLQMQSSVVCGERFGAVGKVGTDVVKRREAKRASLLSTIPSDFCAMPIESSTEGPAAKKQKLTPEASSADPAPPLPAPVDLSAAAPESSAPAPSHSTGKHIPEHGNYRGYYSKRKTSRLELDPRLAILPPEWFHNARVLDVGCNSGVVTVEVGQRFRPARVTGVDIDDALIGQARKYGASGAEAEAESAGQS